MTVRVLLIVALAETTAAAQRGETTAADRGQLAALTAAPDARHALAIGPDGQLYEPDGAGGWARRHVSAIAGDVIVATHAGARAIVGVAGGPPFAWSTDAWTALDVGPHAKALVGGGPFPTAAVGRAVLALDRPLPHKLADAPAPVLALAASPTSIVIETEHGLARLDPTRHAGWKPIAGAPARVTALVSDRWALIDRGVVDLTTARTIALPASLELATSPADDTVIGVAGHELVTVHAGHTPVRREPIPVDHPAQAVGIAADRDGRVVVALRDGRICVRDHGTWTTQTVRDDLPPPRPGAAPATSR